MMRIRLPYRHLFTKISLTLGLLLAIVCNIAAQSSYSMVGDAVDNGGNCYTLTQAIQSQRGAVWHNNRIDLNQNFDITFTLNLGTNSYWPGGDGMAFVLQSANTSQLGGTGSALGYGADVNYPAISPSLAVEFDTYTDDNGATWDHTSLALNGDYTYASGQGVSPVQLGIITDGAYHTVHLTWNATTKLLAEWFDGVLRITYQKDLANLVFGGQNLVYFGVTAATGGSVNQQSVCFNNALSTFTEATPPTPVIAADGPTVFCQGGSVNLSASAAKNDLQFNGTNYVEAPSTSATTLTNALTVEAWVKTDQPNATQYIATKGKDDLVNGQYGILMVGGSFQFHMWQNGHQGVYGTSIIQAGQWYHVAGTWDGTTAKLYVNGILEGQSTLVGPLTANSDFFEIGRLGKSCCSYPMYGSIDEVRIWNVARTQSQIQTYENGNVAIGSSNLVAYYKLDEGTGTTTADAANANTASLYNSPAWQVSGAPLNYASYAWSSGSTASSINVTSSGTYSVTVTDANGNTGSSSPVVVTVNPLPATPVITTSTGSTSFCNGQSLTLTSSLANTYYWSNGPTSQSIVALLSGIYSVTISDVNGCQSTSAVISVTSYSMPSTPIITPATSTVFCTGGSVVLNITNTDPSVTYQWDFNGSVIDGATGNTYTASLAGNYSVVATNTGGCSSASGQIPVTVNAYPANPVISAGGATTFCPSGSVVLTASAGTSYSWSTGASTQAITVSTSGSYTVTVSNASGCAAVSSPVSVTVIDVIPPVPDIATLPIITGECSASVTAPTATDNCSGTVTGTTTDPITYGQQGSYVIHWTFRDASGNTSTSTQNVIIKDITPPVINSVVDINVFATSGAGAVVNYTAPVGTDNCSVASTTLTAGLASGATFPIGTTKVTYTVTDGVGLTTSTSFNVTVSGLAPQIVVPANINVNNDAGQCGAVVSFTAYETTGIPASTITYSIPQGSVFPVGTTSVTATATNAVGVSTKTFTITVTDNEKPNFIGTGTTSISIPYLQTPVSSWAPVTYNFADPLPAGSVVTGIDFSYSGQDQGWGYTGGTNNLIVSGTSIGGNQYFHYTQSFTLNYTGSIPGYVYGGNNTFQFYFVGYPGWQGFIYGGTMTIHYQNKSTNSLSVKNDAGKCGAAIILSAPTVSDNCSVANVTNDAPALFPIGTTTVTWTATDIHGNSNTASQSVTVIDSEPPTITAPANLNVNTDSGTNTATHVNLGTPVTKDNCSVANVTNDTPTVFPMGTTTVTWTVTDIHNNTTTATQTVTVIDNQPPVAKLISAIVKNNDPGVCGAIVTYPMPLVTDNVSTTNIIISAGDADGAVVFNTPLLNNVSNINFVSSGIYNDIAHGHGVNITVTTELFNPLTNAWILVQTIQTGTDDYHFGGTSVNFPVISQVSQIRFTASQFVGAAFHIYQMGINLNSIGVAQITGLPSGSLFPVGTTVNTFTSIDIAGNATSSSFTITVIDTEKPQISNISGSSHYADTNCSWTGSGGSFSVSDNCPAPIVLTEQDFDLNGNLIYNNSYTVSQGINSLGARTFPLGVNTVTIKATDAAGNVSAASVFTVTVRDTISPSIVVSGNITQSANPGICKAYVRVPQPVTKDNCGVQSVTNSYNGTIGATDNYPVGVTVITWTVTDGSGNKATATQTITVIDNEAPMINNVPMSLIQTNDAGTCGAVVTWPPVWATDNCGVASFVSNHQSGEIFPLGVTTVTFTATDIHNNTSTSGFTITVTDNEAPKIITKPVTVTLVNGSASIRPSDINNGSTDNCGAVTLSASKTTFTCTDAGVNQVTLTVTDAHGNTSSANSLVTVTGQVPISTIVVTPSNNVYTGGTITDLYLGYGPQSVTLKDSVTGITPLTYAWTGNGTLSCTNCASAVFTPTAAGYYTFQVTATNQYGCTTSSTVSVCVRDIRVTGTNGSVYVCHTNLATGALQTLTLASNLVANQLAKNPQDVLGSCGMAPCYTATGVAVASTDPKPVTNPGKGNILQSVVKGESAAPVEVPSLTVKVSPNPTSNTFTFLISSARKTIVSVRLMDVFGRVTEINNQAPLDVAFRMGDQLLSGIYFAEVIQGNERVVVKLIKENR